MILISAFVFLILDPHSTFKLWYGFLMRTIPGTSLKRVLQRTFLDQACFAPIFAPTFMTSLMILEQNNKTVGEIVDVVKRDAGDVIMTNWALWIPAMLVNFRYVPGKWQVLFSNGVGFIWNVYLSWKTQEN